MLGYKHFKCIAPTCIPILFQNNKLIDSVLSDLYEDIHWLLLIAGNVLTLDTDGEAALIPSEVMRFSLERQASDCRLSTPYSGRYAWLE